MEIPWVFDLKSSKTFLNVWIKGEIKNPLRGGGKIHYSPNAIDSVSNVLINVEGISPWRYTLFKMIIDCISDLHGKYPTLKGGDLLLLAGDYTGGDTVPEWNDFLWWLKNQPYKKKVMIGGNHDGFLFAGMPKSDEERKGVQEVRSMMDKKDLEGVEDFEYLCDSGITYEGLKIWGSPWTHQFDGINPRCSFFTVEKNASLNHKWSLIPDDVDILITHTPAWLILDKTANHVCAGDFELRQHLENRLTPKLHIFGHIHEQGGKELVLKRKGFGDERNTLCANVSLVDERYRIRKETLIRRKVL